jgi:hypothetical protein
VARKSAFLLGFLLLLTLAAKAIWLGREQWHLGQGTDDGVYLASAKAIAMGQGYRVPSLPGAPCAVKYPPVYPLFLSMAWRIRPDFPASARVGAMMQALLLPILLALLLAILRRFRFSWTRAFLVTALTVVSLQVLLLSTMLFSELLCMCLLFGSILAVERCVEIDEGAPARARSAVLWAMAAGTLAGLAYLTRNAMLPLLGAAPVYLWVKKKPRAAVYFLLLAIPMAAAWHLWAFAHSPRGAEATNGTYLHEYLSVMAVNGFWSSFLNRLAEFSGGVADSILPGVITALAGLPLYHIALAAAVSGCIRIGRRCGWPLYLIFSFLCCLMMLFWWSDGLMRLTVPAWPALLAGASEEVAFVASMLAASMAKLSFWSKRPAAWRTAPRWIFVVLAVLTILRNESFASEFLAKTMDSERRMRLNDQPAFDWIAAHRTPETVVLAWKDTTTFLYTGAAASRGLFIAATPESAQTKTFATSFADLPPQYSRGLLLILRSDLSYGLTDRDLDPFKAAGAALTGSELAFSSPGAFIYSFPIPLSQIQK